MLKKNEYEQAMKQSDGLIDECDFGDTIYQTFLRKRQYEPSFDEIKKLRGEIVCGSYYLSDYTNSFGFDEDEVYMFFESYLDFMQNNYEEEHGGKHPNDVFDLESDENLEEWFECWLCGIGGFTQYYEQEVIEHIEQEQEVA